MGRDSSVGIAGARISAPLQTDYTMGTGSFPGVNWTGRGVDHPPHSSVEVRERVELYLYSPSWAFFPCSRVNYTFTLHYITLHYITLHYIILHYSTLHYITLHYITLHYITLHYSTLHYITVHYITLLQLAMLNKALFNTAISAICSTQNVPSVSLRHKMVLCKYQILLSEDNNKLIRSCVITTCTNWGRTV